MFSQCLKSTKSSGNLAVKYKNNLCNLCNSQQNKTKQKKCTKKNGNIKNTSEVEKWHFVKKKGDVTKPKTVGGGTWLICTVHRVTADCA